MKMCPCGSDKDYRACCDVIHREAASAANPEAMMRARYSAFVLKMPKFLWKTWHPSFRKEVDSSFEDTFESVIWIRLKVLEAHFQGNRGEVRFEAVFRENEEVLVLRETSRFSKKNWWLYENGDVEVVSLSQIKQKPNDLCLCGSGKKAKRCCAKKV